MSEVDSTNDELRRRAALDPAEGLVVAALRQTAGRGRRGRTWASPTGNLYLSVRLRQGDSLSQTAQLSYVAALALAEALSMVAPHLAPRLKWPNDVLVQGGKVSGILLETDGDAVILGSGINVTEAPEASDALYPPISLRAAGAVVPVADLLQALLTCLADMVSVWRQQGMSAIAQRWRQKAIGLGQPVIARLQNGQEKHGIFVDLAADGAMLLRHADGQIEPILAGDIFFPPPAASG
jgi:BirA family biotin operon repressor/biotin-[acetyl-CoA-carboxylase] ligase